MGGSTGYCRTHSTSRNWAVSEGLVSWEEWQTGGEGGSEQVAHPGRAYSRNESSRITSDGASEAR